MCGPYASSSLSEEYIRHKQTFLLNNFKTDAKRTVRWWEEPGAYDRLYHIVKNVDEIHMTGGEPMMTPEVADILNSIENTDVRISFNTNMTKFSDRIFDALSRFKKVEIYASLEGIEKHNDYIRYGSEWAVIEQAIEKIKTYPGIRLSIHPVLQHVSIYSMPNLVEFANNNKIRLQFNEIYPESAYGDNNGGYLTLNSAAPNDVDKFKQYLAQHPNPTLEKWASTYKFDPELHATFRRFVAMTDSIRGVSFEQTFNPSWI
jgi:sulfatase maturation enzyme AslB (radical SAM superfamily)